MSERIPAIQVEPAVPAAPSKQPPAPGKLPSAVNGPIYTRSFTGLFRNFRRLGGGLLFLLFFGTLWLNWNGRQAVLWDLPERKFYIFGATFWPQAAWPGGCSRRFAPSARRWTAVCARS